MPVEFLARLQFGFTIAFHYIYPPLSIGLGVIIVLISRFTGLSRLPIVPRDSGQAQAPLKKACNPSVAAVVISG